VSEEVRLQEIIEQNRLLQAENERQSLEIKLLKEKIDLLIRRLFGSKGVGQRGQSTIPDRMAVYA
jgi:hypothetical protein